MTVETKHLSVLIAAPAADVYLFLSDPRNLTRWAAGLAGSISERDGRWVADSPMGQITVEFAEANSFGVVDHWVTVPTGERFYNPLRVIADGTGSEVVFTLRRQESTDSDAFEADVAAVSADLQTLKSLLESA